jgi:hypothetical protein
VQVKTPYEILVMTGIGVSISEVLIAVRLAAMAAAVGA